MYNIELQNKVREYISTNCLSQAAASQMIGISKAFMSLFLNNKPYKGGVTEQEARITEFFKLTSEKQAVEEKALPFRKTIDYVETSISEDVYRLIRYCQIEKGMVVVHGDAGIGKTKGAEKFATENPTSTILLSVIKTSTLFRVSSFCEEQKRLANEKRMLEVYHRQFIFKRHRQAERSQAF